MDSEIRRLATDACHAFDNDGSRLLDILHRVQDHFGHIPREAKFVIAECAGMAPIRVHQAVAFYAFFSEKPQGRIVVRLCDDAVDRMWGYDEVREAFEEALGIPLGGVTDDGQIGLQRTPCIGMSDLSPAALVGKTVFTRLTPESARRIARGLLEGRQPADLVETYGDGNNAHTLVRSMVRNHIRLPGPVLATASERGAAVAKALAMSPAEVIRTVKSARLRGCGGAGFPTGMKWEFARSAPGQRKLIFCNADEGEPGTFKDRVLLTEHPNRVFAGMTIAGYAVGANEGILYLRGEYAYLRPFLEDILARRRTDGLLGEGVRGKHTFDFDIRIQLGAGSYVCGAEPALLRSCEGGPGEPMTRPPFPVIAGYMRCPSVVNNVETLALVTKILESGAPAFSELGLNGCSGTKLLSVCGDCVRPGIFEIPLGTPLREVLDLAGASDAAAVLVGGASGQFVGPDQFDRLISFDDLSTGGAIIVFGPQRSVPEVVELYTHFFAEESCGYCAPCRIGTVLLRERLGRIISGRGEPADLEYLQQLGDTMKGASRCGLGQAAPNAMLSSIKNFRPAYDALLTDGTDGLRPSFRLEEAVGQAEEIAARLSIRGKEVAL